MKALLKKSNKNSEFLRIKFDGRSNRNSQGLSDCSADLETFEFLLCVHTRNRISHLKKYKCVLYYLLICTIVHIIKYSKYKIIWIIQACHSLYFIIYYLDSIHLKTNI